MTKKKTIAPKKAVKKTMPAKAPALETLPVEFGTAFKYPFNRPVGMLNILWILLPIIGWFPLFGYTIRIVKNFVKGDFSQLPLFQFGSDFKLGFFMFLKAIPFGLAYGVVMKALYYNEVLYMIGALFIGIFILPMLMINFYVKETIASFFEVSKINSVFENLGDYVIALLKSLALGLIFLVMMIILVGIPANVFTKQIFLADFYRRKVN
ncbi:MAG: DUF4013 domain-containing protein [Nanoarchaeota archaeon]|nr:DUF4013 domain-containing protein [Nanoarchaeota archaeon]MBU1704138.1 DUF4013 domain-containing protein [Nanoarchaeota archaeon]